jgi:hypothetical protein
MLPATRLNPAYVDVNPGTYAISEEGNWVCRAGRDGRMLPHITFDPFSKQWMYVLAEGAYGLLHASGWTGNRIVFTGPITMIGVDCERFTRAIQATARLRPLRDAIRN